MGFLFKSLQSDITDEYITVRTAAKVSGYNQQYLRRMLRKGVFNTQKIGQIWLLDHKNFIDYLEGTIGSDDR